MAPSAWLLQRTARALASGAGSRGSRGPDVDGRVPGRQGPPLPGPHTPAENGVSARAQRAAGRWHRNGPWDPLGLAAGEPAPGRRALPVLRLGGSRARDGLLAASRAAAAAPAPQTLGASRHPLAPSRRASGARHAAEPPSVIPEQFLGPHNSRPRLGPATPAVGPWCPPWAGPSGAAGVGAAGAQSLGLVAANGAAGSWPLRGPTGGAVRARPALWAPEREARAARDVGQLSGETHEAGRHCEDGRPRLRCASARAPGTPPPRPSARNCPRPGRPARGAVLLQGRPVSPEPVSPWHPPPPASLRTGSPTRPAGARPTGPRAQP